MDVPDFRKVDKRPLSTLRIIISSLSKLIFKYSCYPEKRNNMYIRTYVLLIIRAIFQ